MPKEPEIKKLKAKIDQLQNELLSSKNILNNIPCSIYWKDKNGVYLGCNKYQADMAGFKDTSYMIGKTDYDFPWKDYADELMEIDTGIMTSGKARVLEETPTLFDNRKITMITRKSPLFNEKGDVIGIIGASIDITDRKELEEKLVEQNELMEKIISLIPANVYWKDRSGAMLGCNERTLKVFHLNSVNEYIGKTDYDLANAEIAGKVVKTDQEIMSTNTPRTLEEEAFDDNGNPAIYLTSKAPLHDKNGNVIGILGVSFDITERKKIEQELIAKHEKQEMALENIITLMPGTIYWKNRDGFYLGCNDNMVKVYGYESKDEIVGKNDFELLDKKTARDLYNTDQEIMTNDVPRLLEEHGFDANKNPAIFLTNKVPLHDEKGKVIGLLGISIDITDRKKIEQELKYAKEQAELANKLKTDFIFNMEHDIRTPTSGVYGMIELLAEEENDLHKKEVLKMIGQSAKQLHQLLNDVIAFDKIESGSFPILAKPFDLKKTIDDVIALENPAASIKDLELILDYPSSLAHVFVGDQFRINRILINLISNAIKFTNKGLVKVAVKEVEKPDDKNVTLSIAIRDTGIGINENQKDFLYESFSRGERSAHSLYRGAGLGLKIVKRFVEDINGEIHIDSETEKGTMITIILPLGISLLKKPMKSD